MAILKKTGFIFVFSSMLFLAQLTLADSYSVGKEPKYDSYYEDTLLTYGVDASPQSLTAALLNKNVNVRAYAAIVIKQKGFKQLEKFLLDAFETEKQAATKIKMAATLVEFGSDVPSSYLRTTIENGSESSESILASGLLLKSGDISGYPVIKKAITSPNQMMRVEAVYQLAAYEKFQGRKIKDVEISVFDDFDYVLTKDNSTFVKTEAARELSDTKSDEAMKVLQKHMNDGDEKVRQAISLYMNKMKAKSR